MAGGFFVVALEIFGIGDEIFVGGEGYFEADDVPGEVGDEFFGTAGEFFVVIVESFVAGLEIFEIDGEFFEAGEGFFEVGGPPGRVGRPRRLIGSLFAHRAH